METARSHVTIIVQHQPGNVHMEVPSIKSLRFGEPIKERRTELDFGLRDLAKITDLSATFLSNLERG